MFCPTPFEFGWSADNFGTTWTDAGFGVNSPGHASANTKGANTNLLNGIAFDAYGIAICFTGGNTAGTIRKNLVDILVDPVAGVGNAGSSWTVKIANLLVNSACILGGGYWYYFPLFIPAGTAIGSANQSVTASTSALRVGIKVFGKPKRPEMCRVAHGVQSIGYAGGSTSGTAVTMAYQTKGAWTLIGSVNQDSTFWFQLGMALADTGRAANTYFLDLAWSPDDGTTFYIIAENIAVTDNASEQCGKSVMGSNLPFFDSPADGTSLYVRSCGVGSIAAESNCTMTIYGAYA